MLRIIALAAGRVLNAISAVVGVRLYTEILRPDQVGQLSLYLSLLSLCSLSLIAPVSSYVMRRAIDWHAEGALRERLKRPLFYAFLIGSLAAIGSELFVKIGLLHAPALVAPLVGLAVLGAAISGVGSQLFNYLGRPFTFVALSLLLSCGAVALSGLLCSQVSPTAEFWIAGLAGAQLVGGSLAILLIGRSDEYGSGKSGMTSGTNDFAFRSVASYAAGVLLATCLAWIQSDGYRYLFVRLKDEHTLGLFVAGFAVGVSPMAFVERLITDAYLPALTRDLALKGNGSWSRSWEVYVSGALLPLVLFGTMACSGTHLLAKVLVSSVYSPFAWIGIWGGLVKSLQMMASLYVGFSYAVLETKHLAVPYLIGGIVTLLLMAVFLRVLDPAVGLGASLTGGALASLISMSQSAKKRYGLRFPGAAFGRAAILSLPIIAANIAAKTVMHNPSALAAIAVLAGDGIYIAVVCWLCYPKAAVSSPFELSLAIAGSAPKSQS